MLAGDFQHIGIGHHNALSHFQIFQFRLDFRLFDVDGFGLAGRVLEGQLVFLQVDVGGFQASGSSTSWATFTAGSCRYYYGREMEASGSSCGLDALSRIKKSQPSAAPTPTEYTRDIAA